MAYKNLSAFVDSLQKRGELEVITTPVSPVLEMTEINDRIVKSGGKALLFTNNGSPFPVLLNAFGTEERMAKALGVNKLDEIGEKILSLFSKIMSPKETLKQQLSALQLLSEMAKWMPKVQKGRGACQEVAMATPNLNNLPILTCWPHDGGPFITLPLVHTKDPITGVRNLGMYRMQQFDATTTGMHWHLHKSGSSHYKKYKKLGKRMPVAVALGGDPAITYAATAPLPENMDEYMLAGFLRQKRVSLVKCLTVDLEVPAEAEIIIEGFVEPSEELAWEGPFGDHTGYYSLADYYPKFHVTAITHRKEAVYPATVVGIPPQEDTFLGKATERIFLSPLRLVMAPEIVDMELPKEGVFHNIAIIKIKKEYSGQGFKVMNALWGAGQMMFTKIIIVVDERVDIHDYQAVLAALLSTNVRKALFTSKGPTDVLDHASSDFVFGGKLGFDLTIESTEKNSYAIVPLDKKARQDSRVTAKKWLAENSQENLSFVVFTGKLADPTDLSELVWRVANNIDPARDCFFLNKTSPLFIDGTDKPVKEGVSKREWPNIVTMNNETITLVDEKWSNYDIGPFLPSPSLPFLSTIENDGAIME